MLTYLHRCWLRYYDRKGEIPEGSNGLPYFELPVFNYHEVRPEQTSHYRLMSICKLSGFYGMLVASSEPTPAVVTLPRASL